MPPLTIFLASLSTFLLPLLLLGTLALVLAAITLASRRTYKRNRPKRSKDLPRIESQWEEAAKRGREDVERHLNRQRRKKN